VITRETYQRQSNKISQDLALAEMALQDARLEQLDVEDIVAFAEHVLENAARLWLESPLDQKQRLQKTLFPSGTTFDGVAFGTAVTCSIFEPLRPVQAEEVSLASPTGFEPVLSP
jgi:hypothetical protein